VLIGGNVFLIGVLTGLVIVPFPDGTLPSRRWRPVLWGYAAACAMYVVHLFIDQATVLAVTTRRSSRAACGSGSSSRWPEYPRTATDRRARIQFSAAWRDAHEAMRNELQRDFAQVLPAARVLEFKFITDDNTVLRGSDTMLIGGSAADLAERQRALTPVMARLGPVDLWTLDTLITAGIAANRAEAVRWVLARIRERPAYQKLSERARELDELKAQF
jgi:hypothetical protein